MPALNVLLALETLLVLCHGPQRKTTGILSTPLSLGWQDSPDASGLGPTLIWHVPKGEVNLVTLPVLRLAHHAPLPQHHPVRFGTLA